MTTGLEVALAKLGIEETSRRNGAIRARCPNRDHEDKHPSWSIKASAGNPHHCFSCGFSGNLVTLAAYVRRTTNDEAEAWLTTLGTGEPEQAPMAQGARIELMAALRRGFRLPSEVVFRPFKDWVTPAKDYLLARSVRATQVERWSLGYAVDGRLAGRVVVPIWAWKWRAGYMSERSYVARAFSSDPKRYLYPGINEGADLDVMWGELHWPMERERAVVVVTEGAFDAMAAERALEGLDCVYFAALGGSPSPVRPVHAAKLAGFGAVVLLTDPDAAGDRCAAALAAQLARHAVVERVRLPRGYDANKMPVKELRKTLWPVCRTLCANIT
jgi:DNA primase